MSDVENVVNYLTLSLLIIERFSVSSQDLST